MPPVLGPDGLAAVRVRLDGQIVAAEADVSGFAAREVLGWAAVNDWPRLFPGCASGLGAVWWRDRLADPDDALDLWHLRPVAWALAEQVFAVPWWAARRLARSAAGGWFNFAAWAVANGAHVHDAPGPDALLAAVWAWQCDQVTGADAKAEAAARKALVRQVFDPPGGGVENAVERAARLEANNTLLAALGGGV